MRVEEKDGRLMVVDFNEMDAYKIACKIEKDGKWFYQKIAVGVKDDEVRHVLDLLVKEEEKHLEFFEEHLVELSKDREEMFEEDDILSTMDFGIFQPYQSIDELDNILDDAAKALRMGIAIEERSIEFYEACKDNVSADASKEELQKIVDEELRHKEMLENILKRI